MHPLDWIDDQLAALREADLLRGLAAPLARQGPIVEDAGRRLVNFASNDYLGLAADPRLAAAAATACQTHGLGQASSPLICGRSIVHEQLEQRLAQFEGTEAALLFPSGYAANMGTIPALADEGDAIFADAKNHASLIDGCRLSRAARFIYPHNNVAALDELLGEHKNYRRRLIVTDSLFSMDGDLAPLADLADIARRHDAMLLVDEAHATGVFGAQGRGVAEHVGAEDGVHIRIGTLSKALGAAGGFVAGPRSLILWLANRARSYVFSTAQPASIAAAALTALDIVENEPKRRINLLTAAANLREQLQSQGWHTGTSASQIIPIIIGAPSAAVRLSASLRDQGFWLPPIRPPSVPSGESLLRLSLTAAHTPDMISHLLAALRPGRR
jgi:8-amino-7-oxononanoate synthase